MSSRTNHPSGRFCAVRAFINCGNRRDASRRAAGHQGSRCEAGAFGLRHNETHCTGAERNGAKQTGEGIEKTGGKPSGPKQTEVQSPLSGPRYRGSNPCLPANKSRKINYLRTVTRNTRAVREATLFGPTGDHATIAFPRTYGVVRRTADSTAHPLRRS